jgi:hypothetical protein
MKNGRIKELAEQAGIFENLHTTQKLAELIIRECIDIADGTRYGGGKVVGNRIKFNFGVDNEEIIRKIDDLLNADSAVAEEVDQAFENWCRESDDGGDVEKNCKTHPDAPHGFLRNASHNADRYVCECEHWEEPK